MPEKQKDSKEKETELSPSVEAEGLLPDLSDDHFEVLGQKIQIKPLTIRNQIKMGRILEPYATSAAYEAQTGSWMAGIAVALKHVELIPEIICLLAKNDGKELDYEELLDLDHDLMDFATPILLKFAYKNEKIGKPIIDFFTSVLPQGNAEMVRLLSAFKEKVASKLTT